MGLNTAGINVLGDALAAEVTQATIHSADPGAGGANQSSTAKGAIVLSNVDGTLTIDAAEAFTGGAGAGATHVGLWNALDQFLGGYPLTGDQTFNAAGEYDLTGVTLTIANG